MRCRVIGRRIPSFKKLRFTDSQIIDALKRTQAGSAMPDFCQKWASAKQRSSGMPNSVLWLHP